MCICRGQEKDSKYLSLWLPILLPGDKVSYLNQKFAMLARSLKIHLLLLPSAGFIAICSSKQVLGFQTQVQQTSLPAAISLVYTLLLSCFQSFNNYEMEYAFL